MGAASKKGRHNKSAGHTQQRACFKCQDPTHGGFQCPNIANAQEAKVLYEQHTGRKVIHEVPAGVTRTSMISENPHAKRSPISVMINNRVDASVTLDSGARITLMDPGLLTKLEEAGVKLARRGLETPGKDEGVGGKTVLVYDEYDVDLKFDTPGGPIVLHRAPVWSGKLPKGVGEIVLADEVMARLGYDPVQLLQHVSLFMILPNKVTRKR
eukprot:jgi/Phyca11/103779/e_gw1.8.841.1